MLTLSPVLRVLGVLLIAFAGLMLLPLLVEPTPIKQPGSHFVLAAMATAFCGLALMALSPTKAFLELNRRQGFLLTAAAWTVMPAFGAMPLVLYGLSFTDAYCVLTAQQFRHGAGEEREVAARLRR